MSFRIKGLPAEHFNHLFHLSDEELAKHHAVRRVADDRQPGYLCRVSLTDSKPGDELLLVNYEHLPVDSPYRMRFAIFVRRDDQTYDRIGEVPEQLRKRTLAVRAFDCQGMVLGFELADGRELEHPSRHCSPTPMPNICTCTSPRPAATRRGSSAPKAGKFSSSDLAVLLGET